MSKRLFIVSNRLPVTIAEQPGGGYSCRPSSGGLISAISAWLGKSGGAGFSETLWAGVPGCTRQAWRSAAGLPADYTYLPVFMNEALYEPYYNGFSNSLLWPLFHYFPSFADYTPAYFDAYLQANEAFAGALLPQLKKDDVVWIHDYHLLPLAGLLRKAAPAALTIGFFLHIPFPSYELFRVMPKPWQRTLLAGMLGADLVGFHTADYTAHFLHCIEMVLKTAGPAAGSRIAWGHRQVTAGAFPISIDFNRFHSAAGEAGVQQAAAKYRAMKGNRKLIFSVDRLDYTKGISNRLKGYERFLTDHPAYADQVVFVLNIVPSRDAITKYAERKRMIDEYIGNFNSRLGSITWQPVIYQYNHLSFDELAGLYTACDLALITPLRDGMNLVAKEFVASRADGRGVLVLSEMAGAAHELTEALLINPNDVSEIAGMIHKGLEMPAEEQAARLAAMRQRISQYDVVAWAADFFARLQAARAAQPAFEIRFIDKAVKIDLFRQYAAARQRLLLLDYDGTLVPFTSRPGEAAPGAELLAVLEQLCRHPSNEVYIISGRDSHTLEQWLGHLPAGIIAEHGAKMRQPGGPWQTSPAIAAGSTGADWMPPVERLMTACTLRCADSFIEQKEYSLAWHYRNAAPGEGTARAGELYEDLAACTQALPLQVLHGHKVVEVRMKGITKGLAVEKLLRTAAAPYDFILAAGDDQTDEDMFRSLAYTPEAFTIKVGNEASFAKYNLHTPAMIQSLLQTMAQYATVLAIAFNGAGAAAWFI